MKEYLTKNSNGDYQLVNHRFSDDDIKVPDGAEIAYLHKDDGIEFSKMQEGEFYRYYWGKWRKSLFDNIQELSQETFFDSVLWKRSTIVEYLNPADWSLHVVDVDNDAVGEDWIKVPDGADTAVLHENGDLTTFYKNNMSMFSNKYTGFEWEYANYDSRQRYSQPEELPFVDDEPKHQHYFKDFSDCKKVDVYRVLDRFNVVHPCQQHIAKKALCAGNRGHKDLLRDIQDIIDTAERWKEMLLEDKEQSQ